MVCHENLQRPYLPQPEDPGIRADIRLIDWYLFGLTWAIEPARHKKKPDSYARHKNNSDREIHHP